MLTSFASNIETICKEVVFIKPTRILDVGGAFGKYGLLIREAIASDRTEKGDLCPDISDIIIDNYEYAGYFKSIPWLDKVYNTLYWDDIRNNPEICNNYQLVLMIDVIEHWKKEDFWKFKEKVNSLILISTPKKVSMYKEKHYGFDQHCSQWSLDDFQGKIKRDISTDNSIIIII